MNLSQPADRTLSCCKEKRASMTQNDSLREEDVRSTLDVCPHLLNVVMASCIANTHFHSIIQHDYTFTVWTHIYTRTHAQIKLV